MSDAYPRQPSNPWLSLCLRVFAAGTQVVVSVDAQGHQTTASIETIKVGDTILTRDQSNRDAPLEERQVTAVTVNTVDHLRLVDILEADGTTQTLRTTDDHPFFVAGIGWTTAENLRPGEQLLTENGQYASVLSTAIEEHPEGISVYNLTVDGDHTYFVTTASGEEAVWVHNNVKPKGVYEYKFGDDPDADLLSELRDLQARLDYDWSVNGGKGGPDRTLLLRLIKETKAELDFRAAFRAQAEASRPPESLIDRIVRTTPLPPTDPNAPSMSASRTAAEVEELKYTNHDLYLAILFEKESHQWPTESMRDYCREQAAEYAARAQLAAQPGGQEALAAIDNYNNYMLCQEALCALVPFAAAAAKSAPVKTRRLPPRPKAGPDGEDAARAAREAAKVRSGQGTAVALNEAFHYTSSQWVESIRQTGLRKGAYATPDGTLSPVQAKVELALPPTGALPSVRVRIDVQALRSAGYVIPPVTRVSGTVVGADERVYHMPGGGYEMKFPYKILPEYLEIVP